MINKNETEFVAFLAVLMQAKENANKLTYAPGDSEVVRSTNKKRAPSPGEYLNEGLITAGRNLRKTNTDEMIRQAVANYQPDSDYRYKAGTGEIIKIIG